MYTHHFCKNKYPLHTEFGALMVLHIFWEHETIGGAFIRHITVFIYGARCSLVMKRVKIITIKKTIKCCRTSRIPNLLYMRVREICLCVREILHMNAHETFTCTNVNYRTENAGQNSKITFFNWMTLAFDL